MSPANASKLGPKSAATDLAQLLLVEAHAAEAAFTHLAPDRAIHAGRVRLKRVRAIARLALPAAPWTARRINRTAGEIMAGLSGVRDAQALEACARAMAARCKPKTARAFAVIGDVIAKTAPAVPDLRHAAHEARNLAALARALPSLDNADLAAGAQRIARRARKAARAARGRREEALRHTWRKREKDRHYAMQILAAIGVKSPALRSRTTSALADLLGEERDVMLLRDWLDGREAHRALKPKKRARAQKALAKRLRALAQKVDRLAQG